MSNITVHYELDNFSDRLFGMEAELFLKNHNQEYENLKVARMNAFKENKKHGNDSHIQISNSGVINKSGNHIVKYKGHEIISVRTLPQKFLQCAENIENSVKNLFGKETKVNVLNIKVKTASNSPVFHEKVTFIEPVEKDKISTCNSADNYIWYNVEMNINGKIIDTTWLCLAGYEPTYYSTENAAVEVLKKLKVDNVAGAIECMYAKNMQK